LGWIILSNCIILTGGTWTPEHFPKVQRSLGPYRVATSLEAAGYSTTVIDYVVNMTVDEIIKVISKNLTSDTLWVGFSSTFFWANDNFYNRSQLERMYWTDYEDINKIISYVREHSTAKVVYGGAKAPFSLVDKNIDYYVVGYADNSIIELSNYLKDGVPLTDVQEITIDDSISYVIDSNKYPEPKMDNITTNWWNKQYNILPNEGLPIELARGCIFKCKFCTYPLLGKKKGTYLRDPECIKEELIKMWESTGTASYYFTDDTFNDDNDKIESLHKVFTSLPFKPQFSAYLRMDLINKFPHQADMLTEMGLVGTYFGIETLQADSAKCIGKGLSPQKVKDRLYWLHEKWNKKVNIGAGFILGLPYDTFEYYDDLYKWCLESDNPLQQISFYPLYLFNRQKGGRLDAYTSEFSLNPDIYGYTFPTDNIKWELKSQNLSYDICKQIASDFSRDICSKNKFAEFQMITALNTGIKIDDLYNLTEIEIFNKYDIPAMNKLKIDSYKQMIGAM
jgi:hypothetical protein